MKRFKRKITYITLIFFLLLTNNLPALCRGANLGINTDSIDISLLTCGPRPYIYSLYGHTAIRYHDKDRGIDLAVNYGVFSFDKPYFVLRFVFGLTDYEMGIENFSDFMSYYSFYGCGIRQQTLNLTGKEKEAIAAAIDKNYRPENRVYRYNYFYDNCTTRARDILTSHINGTVIYKKNAKRYPSFRSMIHSYNETHRWARFGNDLLLGVKADLSTTLSEQQFLPENLANDFASAVIISNSNKERTLVKSDNWILPCTQGVGNDSFPLSPFATMAAIALIVILMTMIEIWKNRNFWFMDAMLMLLCGLCGAILFAMVFSQHPTVSLNMQILLLNPVMLLACLPTVKALRRGQINIWIKVWVICIILFCIGGILQSYAEGMYFVALSLLFRYISKIYFSIKRNIHK